MYKFVFVNYWIYYNSDYLIKNLNNNNNSYIIK